MALSKSDLALDDHVRDPQGKIARIAHGDEEAKVLKEFSLKSSDVKRMAEGQFFMPGGSKQHQSSIDPPECIPLPQPSN